ncbi:MAG: PadR family transcriptional regulator [Ktedonobacterales bacterium]|nr:PadR family transcriptional regulator [Ktedonobacterales bacterium]
MMRHFARRFPFGPGMGPFGPGMGPRMFGRGDFKYGLLKLLRERPKHGYEMMKELEDLSGGFYSPSAGAIYPTLQLLEDRGWVTSQLAEGKKVYTITEAGSQALDAYQQREEPHGPEGGPRAWGGPMRPERPERPGHPRHHPHHGPGGAFPWEARHELRRLAHEAREVAHLMRNAVMTSGGDPERLAQLQAIVERARADLLAYVRQQEGQEPGTPGGSSGSASARDTTII